MNRPLDYSDADRKTKVAIAVIAPIGVVSGCVTIVFLGFIAMAGIFVYFGADPAFPTVDLLNKTGQSLTIIWDGQSHVLTTGKSLKLRSCVSSGFMIKTEKGEKRSYELARTSIDGVYIMRFDLQIEPDGSIYLLEAKPPWKPSPKLQPQPKGYPLHQK